MGAPFSLGCFLSLLICAFSLHSSSSASLTPLTPQLSFLQSQIKQSAILVTRQRVQTAATDPLLYIKDEDENIAVAIDYADARAYAAANEDCEDDDELTGPKPSPYMVGDLFDNGRSDTSKLQVNAQSPGQILTWGDYVTSTESRDTSYDYVLRSKHISVRDREMFEDLDEMYQFDLGDVTQIRDSDDLTVESVDRTRLTSIQLAGTVNRVLGDRLEYIDKDDTPVLYSKDGYEGLVGDMTDNVLSDEVPLTLRQILSQRRSSQPQAPAPAYDLDDLMIVGDPESVRLVNKDVTLIPRTQDIPRDINQQQVYLQGRRYVQTDTDEVPIFYSEDSAKPMVGDMYSNKRTDATPLRQVVQARINPLSWFKAPTTVVVQAQEVQSRRTVQVEERDYRVERQDLDDMKVEESLEKMVDYEIIPVYADNRTETYMVGDLFPNKRTDNAKLEVLRLSPTPVYTENTTKVRPVKRDYDLDEVDNVYLNSTWVDVDIDEGIIEPRVSEEDENDQDELLFASPTAYMTGDMFDNSRSDSSRLSARVERPSQNLTKSLPSSIDIYRITEYVVPVSTQPNATEDPNEVQAFKRIEDNQSFRQALSQSAIQQGIRLAMVDMDDTPVLFSSDSRNYIGGDLFANDRSDTSKLRVVLRSATLSSMLRWRDVEDGDDLPDARKVANPGFLA